MSYIICTFIFKEIDLNKDFNFITRSYKFFKKSGRRRKKTLVKRCLFLFALMHYLLVCKTFKPAQKFYNRAEFLFSAKAQTNLFSWCLKVRSFLLKTECPFLNGSSHPIHGYFNEKCQNHSENWPFLTSFGYSFFFFFF